jgi:hypothetical protein
VDLDVRERLGDEQPGLEVARPVDLCAGRPGLVEKSQRAADDGRSTGRASAVVGVTGGGAQLLDLVQ